LKSESRWPALAFGGLVSIFGIALALADLDNPGRGAFALIVYAALITLHALHSRREWLGYFATAAESLAVVYALNHFNLDLWLPALTLLSVLYYASGFFFRRRADETSEAVLRMRAWGNVLINSGLSLGILLSLTSLVLAKETSGWYIIVIALLFAVEVFARPLMWLELAVEALLSISLYLILDDFNVSYIGHFLFGASLIWLAVTWYFDSSFRKTIYRPSPLDVLLVFLSTFSLIGEARPLYQIYFSCTPSFSPSMLIYRENCAGYFATAFRPGSHQVQRRG
jgi:hypothetical protein